MTTEVSGVLADTGPGWIDYLRQLDECPWPGPRPLNAGDEALLVGRDDDVRGFLHAVKQHSLIVLHGVSGVGKSSLLNVGLLPALADDGFVVVKCDDYGWEAQSEGSDDLQNTLRFLSRQVMDQAPGIGDEDSFFAEFHNAYGSRGVLVLDQFEELIRHSQVNRDLVFDLIQRLHKALKTKIVISLRSEYLHELQSLERAARAFSYTQFELGMVKPEYAVDIVLSARQIVDDDVAQGTESDQGSGATHTVTVNKTLANKIADNWIEAGSSSGKSKGYDPFGRIGLLHLQAFLYALYAHQKVKHSLGKPRLDLIDENDLDDVIRSLRHLYLETRRTVSQDSQIADVYRGALLQTTENKLAACRLASLNASLDPYLVQGAADYVARMAPHLSSGGFKIVRDASDLAALALAGDFDVLLDAGAGGLSTDESDYQALFRVMMSLIQRSEGEAESDPTGLNLDLDLTCSREEISRMADRVLEAEAAGSGMATSFSWRERVTKVYEGPWEADPQGLTCGVMAGLAPVHALIEELRRFVLAIWWMHESSLVRLTRVGHRSMLSLIHDGFGAALTRWARLRESDPKPHMFAITAQPGITLDWRHMTIRPDSDMGVLLSEGRGYSETTLTLPNLNWRGLTIDSANFERVVFVNCDFRGALWLYCEFDSVSFVNCHMDGVIFSECTFRGTPKLVESLVSDNAAGDEASAGPEDAVGSARGSASDVSLAEGPPRYLVPVSPGLIQSFRVMRGRTGDSGPQEDGAQEQSVLYAPVPGAPTVPDNGTRQGDLDRGRLWHFTPVGSGVGIFGGRLSSFVIRACDFKDGGLSLHRTAGSGIELVELSDRRTRAMGRGKAQDGSDVPYLSITASAVRNLTLSSEVKRDLREGGNGLALASVAVRVGSSLLAQTWVGQGLVGRFDVRDSTVVQVWNEATLVPTAEDDDWYKCVDFRLRDGSNYYGLVGVDVDERTCTAMSAPSVGHGSFLVRDESDGVDITAVRAAAAQILASTRQLDYIRNPAKDDRDLSNVRKKSLR